ncbi:MAG: 50S ribosomal protein L25 [Planctomycetota bacterium]|nr:MAG: 50S ribosomal protein L25 [Planctomycetota bacterium]
MGGQTAVEQVTLNRRSELGSTACRRLRRRGLVPGIIYWGGKLEDPDEQRETIPVVVARETVEDLIRHEHTHAVLKAALDGQVLNVLIREIQIDPVDDAILHVDFQAVKMSEVVTVTVPIVLHGTAPGTLEGGVLMQPLRELEIEARVDALPEEIEVSVNELHIGDQITVGDLQLPDGVTTPVSPDELVVQVEAPTEVAEEELEAAEQTGEPEVVGEKKEEDQDEGK